ncbi:uncharacterized protein METZ01_LOCUS301700 [marine metagenome]|uniref:Rod shape-determining protein MreD n=1 Tax=marine metagenome TaxID=408172 RepID=A0A382MJC6_9ZZZZ
MIIRGIGLVLLSFIVQTTIAEDLALFGVRPDLIFIILVFMSLAYGSTTGMIFGFSAGLLQDFYEPASNLGLNALCKSLVCFGIGLGKDGLQKEVFLIMLSVLATGMLVHETLYFLIYVRFDVPVFFEMIWRRSLPTLLYTCILGAVLAGALKYDRGSFDGKRLFPE